MTTNRSQEARAAIGRALVIAGLFLQASIAIKSLTPGQLSPELGQRWLGVLMGAVVVFFANAAPKTLAPLTQMRCDPAAEQAIRRFAAWSLTLGGVAYLLTWMLAPLETATALSTSFLGSSVLLVLVRLAGVLKTPTARFRRPDSQGRS